MHLKDLLDQLDDPTILEILEYIYEEHEEIHNVHLQANFEDMDIPLHILTEGLLEHPVSDIAYNLSFHHTEAASKLAEDIPYYIRKEPNES